jgi:hypothetical protein
MRRLAMSSLTLVALIVLTPVVWASTAETWTDGIYDYEAEGTVQVAVDSVATVDCAPIPDLGPAALVLGLVTLLPEVSIHGNALPPVPARAPPLS